MKPKDFETMPPDEESKAAASAAGDASASGAVEAEEDGDFHQLDFSKLDHKKSEAEEPAPASRAEAAGQAAAAEVLPEPQPKPVQSWKITLLILTTAAVLMSLSYTMLIPFLPTYLMQELGVDQSNVNLWSGIVFSASFLISGIMAPIWGAMSDRGSRKLMAIRSAAMLAIAYGLSGLVQNEWQLLAVRCFQGFAAGLWPACLAILSNVVPKERLGFSLGTMQGASTCGGVLGPLFGGVLAEIFGMRMTFFVGAAALAFITVLIIVCIKEPAKKRQASAKKAASTKPKTNLLKIPVVQRLLFTAGIVQMTILLQQPVMPLYVAELQGSMDRIVFVTGLLFSIVGISGVIASPLWGIAGQKFGYRPTLYVALLGSAVFGMIQAIPDSLVPFGAWRFLGGLAFAGIFPAINALLTNNTGPEDRGRIFGLSFAFQQAGSVIGPIAGGGLALFMSIKIVIFISGFILLPLVIYLYMRRPAVETSMKGVELKMGDER